MLALIEILKNILNVDSIFLETTILTIFLGAILALVFVVGWKVNNKGSNNYENLAMALKKRYENGEIPAKEYNDIRDEISEYRRYQNSLKRYLS